MIGLQKGKKRQIRIFKFAPHLIALAATAAGVLVGAFSATKISDAEAVSCAESIKAALASPEGSKGFYGAFIENIKFTAVYWFLGTTVIGSISLTMLSYCRGYSVGLTVAFLIKQYALTGFLASAAGVLPHTLIYIPAYILMAGFGIQLSVDVMSDKKSLKSLFVSYSARVVIMFALVCVGAVTEGYFSSWLFRVLIS